LPTTFARNHVIRNLIEFKKPNLIEFKKKQIWLIFEKNKLD